MPTTSRIAPAWIHVADTANSRIFEVEAGILVVVPHDGSVDTEADAREKIEALTAYFAGQGRRGTIIVLVDALRQQDRGARRAYQNDAARNPRVIGTAIVSSSALGRAIASFFLGLSKMQTPMRLFATVEEAVPWCRAIVAADDPT